MKNDTIIKVKIIISIILQQFYLNIIKLKAISTGGRSELGKTKIKNN